MWEGISSITLMPNMPINVMNQLNHIINSSIVAVLSGLSRVLFMQGNDYKAKMMTFVACVSAGLVAGIIVGNNGWFPGYHDIIVALVSLCAKEIIEYLSERMRDPLSFYTSIRNTKKNDTPTAD